MHATLYSYESELMGLFNHMRGFLVMCSDVWICPNMRDAQFTVGSCGDLVKGADTGFLFLCLFKICVSFSENNV